MASPAPVEHSQQLGFYGVNRASVSNNCTESTIQGRSTIEDSDRLEKRWASPSRQQRHRPRWTSRRQNCDASAVGKHCPGILRELCQRWPWCPLEIYKTGKMMAAAEAAATQSACSSTHSLPPSRCQAHEEKQHQSDNSSFFFFFFFCFFFLLFFFVGLLVLVLSSFLDKQTSEAKGGALSAESEPKLPNLRPSSVRFSTFSLLLPWIPHRRYRWLSTGPPHRVANFVTMYNIRESNLGK